MKDLKINHAAVWVSIVVFFAMGFLWYGPLFGEIWMNYVGLDMATIEANPPGASLWISNIIATAISVYVLAWLFAKMKISSAMQGAITGLVIAFGLFYLPTMINNLYAQGPYGLSWITGGYEMVCLSLSGLILGGWRKK